MRTHGLTAIIAALFLLSLPAVAPAAPVGDTKYDLGAAVAPPTAGDTKFDSPGASRAPALKPPATIHVVRPERTIVRESNELATVLAGVALLVAVGAAGLALLRTRRIAVR